MKAKWQHCHLQPPNFALVDRRRKLSCPPFAHRSESLLPCIYCLTRRKKMTHVGAFAYSVTWISFVAFDWWSLFLFLSLDTELSELRKRIKEERRKKKLSVCWRRRKWTKWTEWAFNCIYPSMSICGLVFLCRWRVDSSFGGWNKWSFREDTVGSVFFRTVFLSSNCSWREREREIEMERGVEEERTSASQA